MKHLSNLEIHGFLQRDLEPHALLELDDHLAVCPECQVALEQAGVTHSSSEVASEFLNPEPHLTYEELRAFAANDVVAPAVTAHAANCKSCTREAAEFKAFAAELDATPRIVFEKKSPAQSKVRRWRIHTAWYALAATILVVAIAGVYWRYSLRQENGANMVAILHDGDAQLTLDPSGRLHGEEALTHEQQEMVRAAMMNGKLEPALPPEFAGQKTETMLGVPQTVASFTVLSPVNRVSIDDRPSFQWEALDGAAGYRVVVFGAGYQKIVESPVVHETKWQTSVALPRGAVYTWTVTANGPRGSVHSPAPPQPEAIFKVISADEEAALEEAARDHAGDPLLLAALYARAGAVEEAKAQISKLASENPNSALVTQLRASLSYVPSPIKTNAAQ